MVSVALCVASPTTSLPIAKRLDDSESHIWNIDHIAVLEALDGILREAGSEIEERVATGRRTPAPN